MIIVTSIVQDCLIALIGVWSQGTLKLRKTSQTVLCLCSVWIAQDTTESRVPRLNVHTNQILAHTFSHGTLDSVLP